jgi:hypothetical protein
MLMFLFNTKTAWNDYFPGISPSQTYVSTFYSTKISPSGPNVYVSNSLFSRCISTSNGGAISSTTVKYLLIESTSFFSCSTNNQDGGAIYITSSNEIILYKVCGYDCCSTHTSSGDGQFAYMYTSNTASDKISFNYSSITRCVGWESASWWTLFLNNGKICLPSVNVSINKCKYMSGIYCYPYLDSNSVTFSLTYSSITDNIATGYYCIFSSTTGSIEEIKYCNILRNTQGSLSTGGTITSYGNLKIEDSCILENKADRIFNQGSSYTITLSNCTVDSTSNNGKLTIKNTVTKSFVHALNHMSTQNCNALYDSVGTLNPIIQTPTSSEKQKLCFTYVNCFYQSQQRIFFSLLSVFLFTFIHLDISYDPLY